jgi:hypothetical protein
LEGKNPQKSIKIEFRCKFDIELRRKYRFNQLIVNQIIFLKNSFKDSKIQTRIFWLSWSKQRGKQQLPLNQF